MAQAPIARGATARLDFEVGEDDTAEALGSGDVPVLATPRLLAWLEAATVAALAGALPEGSTSVGTRVAVEHVRATRVGGRVSITATVTATDGRLVTFDVAAEECDDAGASALVGHGTVTRVVVDRERFLSKL